MFLKIRECESTQTIALENLDSFPNEESVWVLSENMTKGRGRLGRTWQCLSGNLFMSGAFRIDLSKERHWPFVSLLAARALCKALESQHLWNDKLFIKWPNDIWAVSNSGVAGKVGGLLSEIKKSKLIIGLGLNTSAHPKNNEDYPTWDLESILAKPCPRIALGEAFSNEFSKYFSAWLQAPEDEQNKCTDDLWINYMSPMKNGIFKHNESQRELSVSGLQNDGGLKTIYIDTQESLIVRDGEVQLIPGSLSKTK